MPRKRHSNRSARSVSALTPSSTSAESTPAQKRRHKIAENNKNGAQEHAHSSKSGRVDAGRAGKRQRRHCSAPHSTSNSPQPEEEEEVPAHSVLGEVFEKEDSRELCSVEIHSALQQKQIMAADWNYDDDCECGPQHWPGQINGKQQSPIDLRLSKMKVITLQDPLQFTNYNKPLDGEFVNTGHSVQFIPDPQTDGPQIRGGMLDQAYKFVQYHYHWAQDNNEGSEHALCGLRYPAELHLVHQGIDDPTKLAVLGVFLHLGPDNVALKPDSEIFGKISECGQKVRTKTPITLQDKLPESLASFARYQGSLTTPPCSENVVWTIFTEPVEVTPQQLESLRAVKDYRGSIIRKNYRPLQSVNDRNVFLASC